MAGVWREGGKEIEGERGENGRTRGLWEERDECRREREEGRNQGLRLNSKRNEVTTYLLLEM